MLWEHNSTIVVMLTKLREMGRVRVLLWGEGGCGAIVCGHELLAHPRLCSAPATLGEPPPLACLVADPVAPQPHRLPGSGREEQQLVSANVLPCSSSTGEVPSVLACRALCPVPVLRGGPHGRVQHATVHPPGVQGDGCQGECICWLPSSSASHASALPGPAKGACNSSWRNGKASAALHCRQKRLLPTTYCSSHHRFLPCQLCQPHEQFRDPCQHQTLPCLCCSLGQAFNTGPPAPGVCVCSISPGIGPLCDSKHGPRVELRPKH